MLSFIIRRILYTIPLLVVVTIVVFGLMWVQPGDVVNALCGLACPRDLEEKIRDKYGLNDPFYIQYVKWVSGVACCLDFGYSVLTKQPAWIALLGEARWLYTVALIMTAMIISWAVAIPIGIYSATHKYSFGDNLFTFLGFLGLSIPNFILGLMFMFVVVVILQLGSIDPFFQVGGFLNAEYANKPLDLTIMLNFLWHFLPPVLILAAANTAAIIRYMRGSLLDVLSMAYVQTARAKGLKEKVVINKHAVRNAVNPLVSMLGFWVPMMMEGALIISIVFNLPQMEKTFINSIESRDNVVVMTGLFVFSVILIFGNLISDVLLAFADPKIRYD